MAHGVDTPTRDNLTHYNEHIGPLTNWAHVRDWTRDTLRKLSLELDRKVERTEISWKTAVNIWSTATQMCDDAANHKDDAIVCRKDNPAIDVRGPERGDKVGKQFLYPRELVLFLACGEVPLPVTSGARSGRVLLRA